MLGKDCIHLLYFSCFGQVGARANSPACGSWQATEPALLCSCNRGRSPSGPEGPTVKPWAVCPFKHKGNGRVVVSTYLQNQHWEAEVRRDYNRIKAKYGRNLQNSYSSLKFYVPTSPLTTFLDLCLSQGKGLKG